MAPPVPHIAGEAATSPLDDLLVEHGYGNRFQGFQNLMRLRVRDILLVSSLYDLYLFEEDGRLYELIRNEYQGFNLSHSPELTRVSSGQEALRLAIEENRFDLIITTLHIDDMDAVQFASKVHEQGRNIPVVLLAHDNRELRYLLVNKTADVFDKVFIWQGDFRIIIAIIKQFEDRLNVDHDTRMVGVQVVIVVEDNVKDYSSFLPIIYTEILKQSQRLISEGINLTHKFLRMRARPKILLASTYEEAWEYYQNHRDFVLGLISDIDFPRGGHQDPEAGIVLAASVRGDNPDLPVLLLSTTDEQQPTARDLGASFLRKDSDLLLNELSQFMTANFSFGDFIFRMPAGFEVGRATDLKGLEEELQRVPEESIRYHAERNHFSNWLKARTEFWLAHHLRPRKVSDYPSVEALRKDLVQTLHHYRAIRQRGIIADFSKESFDPETSFARVGRGSLGGKARGLGFVSTLINDYNVRERFEGIKIHVPPAIVVGTEVFEQFLEDNALREFAMNCTDDAEITCRFLEAPRFPEQILADLAGFLDIVNTPLAVRSSSLLEDSQYHPFAGVYQTYMLPNRHANPLVRLNELLMSIKRVYASCYYQSTKTYFHLTSIRLEEERMAVIVQKMVGSAHGQRFYPEFAGVAKSHNFYPMLPQSASDGVVAVALGLGKYVVDGGNAVRFCPKYPTDLLQFHSTEMALDSSQRTFYALQLDASPDFGYETRDPLQREQPLETAEADGTLGFVGSTYSQENDVIYDGIARPGARIVTFYPILKHKLFPLPQILELILDMGTWGMGTPVEIEFAVRISVPSGQPREFAVLQMRPLVVHREEDALDVNVADGPAVLCRSNRALGHGVIEDICDAVVVDFHNFDRAHSRDVAKDVAAFNARLIAEQRPYLLVGVGRWGSLDPWLGIPVLWEDIAGARAIVETSFKELAVTPSQGSHFFHNITSFMIGYFTVGNHDPDQGIDWDWLLSQEAREVRNHTRLIRFKSPLSIRINGHLGKGVILKPEECRGED
jgi:CheY-like chemotaxis protein